MNDVALQSAVIATAQRTLAAGLTQGTSGNVSARTPRGFYVTPTGVPYDTLRPADIVELDMRGVVIAGDRRPSSEWRIHRDIYAARDAVGAVVHVHPTFATTIACLRRELPAVHYMIAVAGGPTVRCAEYATFGTEVLSAAVVQALEDRSACLMANHGLLAVGGTLDGAFLVAAEVEKIAELYWRALAVGDPVILNDLEMSQVMERFKRYGQTTY